jgi:soluble lytic murein transglycosylase-like protein
MKKLFMAYILFLLSISCSAPIYNQFPIINYEPIKYDGTLLAIMRVESNFNPYAINIKENAVGILQIRPVMVKEVNKIQKKLNKKEFFTLEDRYDSLKSVKMYYIVQKYHNPTSNPKLSARLWNGGTVKYLAQTEKYWDKVKQFL